MIANINNINIIPRTHRDDTLQIVGWLIAVAGVECSLKLGERSKLLLDETWVPLTWSPIVLPKKPLSEAVLIGSIRHSLC